MNLPFLKNKKEKKEYFLALLLSLGEVRGILFEKSPSGLNILGIKKESFEESLDSLTAERLIELSDIVISEVEKNLPHGVEFQKVIFVVPYAWVIEGKIVKEHLVKLKALCEALRLTPIGFIVSIEAIAAYLQKREGVPVTTIFAEIGQKHITLTIVKNGSVVYIADEEIKENPIHSVEEILGQQDAVDVLPAKIILLNYDNAKKLEQTFLTHQWSKKLQFLHIPKVEVLDTEIESQAVISGVANQLGFSDVSISEKSGNLEDSENQTVSKSESPEVTDEPHKLKIHFSGEVIGFFKDKDVREEEKENLAVSNVEAPSIMEETSILPGESTENYLEPRGKKISSFKIPSFSFTFLSDLVKSLSSGKRSVVYPVAAVLILILIIAGYYFFFEKIGVVLVLNKQEVKKDLTVTFSQDKNSSASDGIVHVSINSIKETGKEEKGATGTKETGDKAKGEVTILSSQNSDTNIKKGTILTSSNSLKFTLDSDVSIASSSGISDIKSTKGKVTAADIGKEYNLPSGTKFVVNGFDTSSVEGKNDSAFSGGTKKEINVVSQKDADALLGKIVDSLSTKAVDEAKAKKSDNQEALNIPLDFSFEDKSFSKNVGDEADTLSLSATISFNVAYYDKNDIGEIAKNSAGNSIPGSYKYSANDSKITVSDVAKTDKTVSGKISFDSVFIPNINLDSISKKIAGKNVARAREIATSDGVTDVQFIYLRTLPLFPKILPFNKKNIVISSKAAE